MHNIIIIMQFITEFGNGRINDAKGSILIIIIITRYMLYLCVTSESLSPTKKGNVEPPRVILRQVGTMCQVWFLKEEKVYTVTDTMELLMTFFNPKHTYLFFDPLSIENTVPYNSTVPVIATVSPKLERYKEFEKNGGLRYYVPCWRLDELLALGSYLFEGDPKKLSLIRDRFDKFGGILRHVIWKDDISAIESGRDNALNKLIAEDKCYRYLTSDALSKLNLENQDRFRTIFSITLFLYHLSNFSLTTLLLHW
jgi:hypothetical protein